MPITENRVQDVARLNIRLSAEIKERIEKAATLSGVSLTDFTVANLAQVADEVLERHQTRKLSNRDRDIFLKMLDDTEEPNQALKDAFKAHDELIAE